MITILSAKLPEQCTDCHTTTYPPQGFCRACLSESVAAVEVPFTARVMASSQLHYSLDEAFQVSLPLTLVSLEVSQGVVVFALTKEDVKAGDTMSVQPQNHVFGNLLTAVKDM